MSTDTDSGFVYLHLDQYGRVDELVAISQEPLLAAHNYLCLYHVHEKYINNLVQRWKDGLIEDFFKYFKEPWACAIFHDRFVDLVDELNEHLQTAPLEVTQITQHSTGLRANFHLKDRCDSTSLAEWVYILMDTHKINNT